MTAGFSQLRGGAHCERHPSRWWDGAAGADRFGGPCLASNMESTTRVWEHEVDQPGPGGACEHLIWELGEARDLASNELVWMTDRCPHAALPQRLTVLGSSSG